MIFGGAFISYLSFISAYLIGFYAGIVPAIVGIMGLSWIVVSIVALFRRKRFAITINETGIDLPAGNVFAPKAPVHIPSDAIESIAKHESIKGRLVEISLRSGGKIPVQIRHYCEIRTFLNHCKQYGLPTV